MKKDCIAYFEKFSTIMFVFYINTLDTQQITLHNLKVLRGNWTILKNNVKVLANVIVGEAQ